LTSGRHTSLEHLLESGVDFHGHLGPYLVLGLRMGRHAVRKLRPKQLHEMSATVWAKSFPPQSCVVDGIQVSSGCTFGKRNISVKVANRSRAEFRKGHRTISVEPTKRAADILSRVSAVTPPSKLREIALALYRMSDRELLNVMSS
jgi:formylmethanofuran dehydrogenase subunit E